MLRKFWPLLNSHASAGGDGELGKWAAAAILSKFHCPWLGEHPSPLGPVLLIFCCDVTEAPRKGFSTKRKSAVSSLSRSDIHHQNGEEMLARDTNYTAVFQRHTCAHTRPTFTHLHHPERSATCTGLLPRFILFSPSAPVTAAAAQENDCSIACTAGRRAQRLTPNLPDHPTG